MLKSIYTKFLFSCIATAMLFAGCDDDYEPLDTVCDLAWYNSETISQGNSEYVMNVDTFISFIDASQGYKSHKWVIEEGSHFMVDDFDYKKYPISSQIDPNKGLVSENAVESVFFGKPGKTTVILIDTFDEWATSHETKPTQTVFEDGQWVLRKVFTVNVYAKPRPAFTVKKSEGTVLLNIKPDDVVSNDKSTWMTVDLEAGESLTFVNNTPTGEYETVEGITWNIGGSVQKSSTANEATFTFNVPAEEAYSEHSLTARRVGKPVINVKKMIPLKVNVVASSKPFGVNTGNVFTKTSNVIYLQAKNGAYGSFSNKSLENFIIKVTDASGEVIDVKITKLEQVEDNQSVLALTLSEDVFYGDKIKLYYDGEGDIESADGRPLISFEANVKNNIFGASILDEVKHGFENEGATLVAKGWFPTPAPNVSGSKDYIDIIPEEGNSGNHVIRICNKGNYNSSSVIAFMHHSNTPIEVPAGKYILSFKVKTSSSGAFTEGKGITLQYKPVGGSLTGSDVMYVSSEAGSSWQIITHTLDLQSDIAALSFRFLQGVMVDNAVVFIDDIELKRLR
ncbi:hypothetical protein NXX42_23310 [Bacteroides thetaiotaomicron]|nr:hypothetical protein [Bacteroides thetaiotaomicron]